MREEASALTVLHSGGIFMCVYTLMWYIYINLSNTYTYTLGHGIGVSLLRLY